MRVERWTVEATSSWFALTSTLVRPKAFKMDSSDDKVSGSSYPHAWTKPELRCSENCGDRVEKRSPNPDDTDDAPQDFAGFAALRGSSPGVSPGSKSYHFKKEVTR